MLAKDAEPLTPQSPIIVYFYLPPAEGIRRSKSLPAERFTRAVGRKAFHHFIVGRHFRLQLNDNLNRTTRSLVRAGFPEGSIEPTLYLFAESRVNTILRQ